jgi:hypothetical protein
MIDPIESESDVVPIATGKPGERLMHGLNGRMIACPDPDRRIDRARRQRFT